MAARRRRSSRMCAAQRTGFPPRRTEICGAGLAADGARWTTGQETDAALIAPKRLGEGLVHHEDLDIGYRPQDWPTAFVSDYLDRAVTGLRGHAGWSGPVRMEATGTGRVHEVGDMTSASPVIAGPEYALLAWLLGRSDGGELSREGIVRLPEVPHLYTA